MLGNAKVYAHTRGGTGCGMLRNASAQTYKREPPTSRSKSPSTGVQPPRTQDEPPKTRSGTPYSSSAKMLGNVKVSRYEQREKTHRSPREARENSKTKRERTKRIYKRSPSEHRESRFNFEGTSRTERRGNAENGTGRMMKNDEIPEEAKRKQRKRRAFFGKIR